MVDPQIELQIAKNALQRLESDIAEAIHNSKNGYITAERALELLEISIKKWPKETALKPCPFCGCTRIVVEKRAEFISVVCDEVNCFARVVSCGFETEAEAIAAWNRRAQ